MANWFFMFICSFDVHNGRAGAHIQLVLEQSDTKRQWGIRSVGLSRFHFYSIPSLVAEAVRRVHTNETPALWTFAHLYGNKINFICKLWPKRYKYANLYVNELRATNRKFFEKIPIVFCRSVDRKTLIIRNECQLSGRIPKSRHSAVKCDGKFHAKCPTICFCS